MAVSASRVGTTSHTRRRLVIIGMAVAAVVAGIVIGAVARVGHRQDDSPAGMPPAFSAQARAGTTDAQLLQLEGQVVGGDAVAVPGERLPDVAAFHRAGIAAMSIDGMAPTVTFLADATQAQRDRVRSLLERSPLIEHVAATGG